MKRTATTVSSERGFWWRLFSPWRSAMVRRRAALEAEELPGYIPGYGYPIGWSGTDRVVTVRCTKEQAQAVVDELNAAAAHRPRIGGNHAAGDA